MIHMSDSCTFWDRKWSALKNLLGCLHHLKRKTQGKNGETKIGILNCLCRRWLIYPTFWKTLRAIYQILDPGYVNKLTEVFLLWRNATRKLLNKLKYRLVSKRIKTSKCLTSHESSASWKTKIQLWLSSERMPITRKLNKCVQARFKLRKQDWCRKGVKLLNRRWKNRSK